MVQVLSSIADEVMQLAKKYRVNHIFVEDGLGKLVGKTKSKKLNGLLNYWGRDKFVSILERKCYLMRNLNEQYKQAISIYRVWPGYSSLIGNVVNWRCVTNLQLMNQFKKPPDGGCLDRDTFEALLSLPEVLPVKLPDAVGSATEIARRGMASIMVGKKAFEGTLSVNLPDYQTIIATQKSLVDVLHDRWKEILNQKFRDCVEQDEKWVDLYAKIKVLIKSKQIFGYRNTSSDVPIARLGYGVTWLYNRDKYCTKNLD